MHEIALTGEALDLRQDVEWRLQAIAQLQVRGSKGWQHQRQGQQRVGVAAQHGEFQGRRDQHGAAHGDAAGQQPLGDVHGAKAAVALANQEHRRQHAPSPRQIEPREVDHRLGILLDAEEGPVGFLGAGDAAAIACRDRIDEHQVREAEPGVGVVGEVHGLQRGGAVGGEVHTPRAHGGKVQEGRRRSGPAVEHEGDGTRLGRRLQRIGDVEDMGGHLTLGARQRQRAGARRVGEAALALAHGVARYGLGRLLLLGSGSSLRLRSRRSLRQDRARAWRQRQQRKQQGEALCPGLETVLHTDPQDAVADRHAGYQTRRQSQRCFLVMYGWQGAPRHGLARARRLWLSPVGKP